MSIRCPLEAWCVNVIVFCSSPNSCMCYIMWLECWLWTVVLIISYMLGIALLQASARIINFHEKWIKFTYFIPQIQTITNLFKHTNLFITFHATKTIYNFLKIEISTNTNAYDTSEIYGLTCATCHLNYKGQIGQSLKQRYSERLWYIQCNNPQSAYANRILQHTREFGLMQNTMKLIHQASEGCLMDVFEEIFIHKCNHEHKLIQEQIPGENNPLFTLLYDV